MSELSGRFALSDLLECAGLARSTYYYALAHPKNPTRPELWDAAREIFSRTPNGCGHRQIAMCLRAERGDDRDCRLTPDERRSLLALWCMGRSPLMVGGDLPTSTSQTIAALANPALREVAAGSRNNHETVRERIFASWDDESSYRGELIVWAADAVDWADGTMSAHDGGHYAALFWTGDDAFELGRNIELQSIVGLDERDGRWTLTDLFAGIEDGATPADVRIEGEGADRVIRGTIPPHGVLWIALDPR